ncbi:MAG TPA: polysaccharide pyruvyl transferase family protein [Epsilonproteobacteria bacterium]|nr:polysaccharide pyruvyl transferase family protein [Campylobacterota bacterium]
MNKPIFLHDTSILTTNLGDEIIMDAVRTELREIFPHAYFLNAPTHDNLGKEAVRMLNELPFSFVGGTNLLSGNMDKYNQWKINLKSVGKLKNVILMGVGWWQYQDAVNRYTSFLLKKVLSSQHIHSVRDAYTEDKLRSIGIDNVLNTGCMTLWKLNSTHCQSIPDVKSDEAVMTFTDYKPSPKYDTELFDIVKKNYRKIYVWLQGSGDYNYVKELFGSEVEYVESSLSAYDELLSSSTALDYIGTRLHAGIRAMQHARRSVIISVDNRATEMGKNFNLPVIERLGQEKLENMINAPFETRIALQTENINAWKAQFAALQDK